MEVSPRTFVPTELQLSLIELAFTKLKSIDCKTDLKGETDRGYITGCSKKPASIISVKSLPILSYFWSQQQLLAINCKYGCHNLEIPHFIHAVSLI